MTAQVTPGLSSLRPDSAAIPLRLPRDSAFANPHTVVRSWYVALPTRKLKRGKVELVTMLGRRLAVWRDQTGEAHAVDARCPHLGADLSQGSVTPQGLRCPFHHWTFDRDGRCVDAPCESSPPSMRSIKLGQPGPTSKGCPASQSASQRARPRAGSSR